MADLTMTQEMQPWPTGMLVTSGDMSGLQANIDNAVGLLLHALGGYNFLPNLNPLQVTAAGGMVVTVGGPNQWVIAQGRPLDVCPTQTFTAPAGGASARTDLIAIQAARVNGSQTTSRNELGSNPPTGVIAQPVTLTAGTATLTFGAAFTATPMVLLRPHTADANAVTVTVAFVTSGGNTTGMTITSPDATDARTFDILVTGPQVGQLGTPATVTLLENHPAFAYVPGTTTATPQAPAGYDAFATIAVPANATAITQSEIAVLFPEFASPVLDAAFRNLSATSLTVNGGVLISANAPAATAQNPHVPSNGILLYAFDWTGTASVQKLGLIQVSSDGTTQTFTFGGQSALANLNAALANLLGLSVTGNATIGGNLRASGSGEFDNGLLVSGPTGLTVTNNATISGSVNAGNVGATTGTIGTLTSDQNGATATKSLTVDQNLTVDGNASVAGTSSVTGAASASQFTAAAAPYAFQYPVGNNTGGLGLYNQGTTRGVSGTALAFNLSNVGQLLALNTSGSLGVAGNLGAADIYASRGDGTGAYFLGDNSHYLYWDKTNYNLPGGPLFVNGAYAVTGITSPDSSLAITEPTPGQVTVTAALGRSVANVATFTAIGQLPITVQLPVLPGGGGAVYFVEAIAIGFDFTNSGGSAKLQAGGGNSFAGSTSLTQTAYNRSLIIAGTAFGGQQPYVTLSVTGSAILLGGDTTGYITLKAIRTA